MVEPVEAPKETAERRKVEEAERADQEAAAAASPLSTPVQGMVDTVGEVTFVVERVALKDPTFGPPARAILAAWTKRRPPGAEVDARGLGELAAYFRAGLGKTAGPRYGALIQEYAAALQRHDIRQGEDVDLFGQVQGFTVRTLEDLGIADDPTTEGKPFPWPAFLLALGLAVSVAPVVAASMRAKR